jgi:hypothetical protein
MRVFLLILSILWVALGATIVLYTNQARDLLRGLVLGMNIRLWAVPAFLVGLMFLIGAFMVHEVFWVALVLGLLAIVKGAYLAYAPLPQINTLFEWWFDRASEMTIRLWGLIVFTFGVTLVSWLL